MVTPLPLGTPGALQSAERRGANAGFASQGKGAAVSMPRRGAFFCPGGRMELSRREVVTRGVVATLLAGLPAGWRGAAYASDAPETPKVRIGIIALTDCSSIVMAHELGLFKKHGIESTISKEASWAVIRDRLTLGENQATHLLLGIPYAATMGLQGSPQKPTIIPCYLNRNGQAITLTKTLLDRGVKTPAQVKPLALEAKAK